MKHVSLSHSYFSPVTLPLKLHRLLADQSASDTAATKPGVMPEAHTFEATVTQVKLQAFLTSAQEGSDIRLMSVSPTRVPNEQYSVLHNILSQVLSTHKNVK